MRRMRTYVIVIAIAVLVFGRVIVTAQQSTSAPSSPPLSVSDIEHGLKAGVTNTRMTALVKQYGVDFELTDAVEKELRAAGATGDLLLAVTRSSHPPVSSAAPTTGSHQGVIPPNLSPGDSDSVSESNAEGRALAAKLVAAMGGEAKLASIRSLKWKTIIQNSAQRAILPCKWKPLSCSRIIYTRSGDQHQLALLSSM